MGPPLLRALQTRQGRDKIATVYLMVALVVNVVATALPVASPNSSRIGTYLLGIGTGILLVSIVNFALNRRAS
ncbi:MAG TPA: hypothetical protein VK669_13580 [Candidatus Limnocylindrales bacterium]|nr:hypothetical protein [Candidatus Limnocylindrales bacterium]